MMVSAVVAGAFLSAQAGQGAAPSRPAVPAAMSCRLITATGEVVGVDVATRGKERGLEVKLAPSLGSRWPAASTGYLQPRKGASRITYVVEHQGDALLFTLGSTFPNMDWQSADLEERRGEGAGLPVARGYCSASPAPALSRSGAAPAQSGDFRDPAHWPNQCVLMTRDGRLSRFRYFYKGRDGVIEPLDKVIWAEERLQVPRVSPPVPPGDGSIFRGFASSRGEGGLPNFAEFIAVDEAAGRAVLQMSFHDLNDEPAGAGDEAFAICGFNDLDRIRQ